MVLLSSKQAEGEVAQNIAYYRDGDVDQLLLEAQEEGDSQKRTALYAKDFRIVAATLAEHHSPAPVSAVIQQLVEALMAAGRAEDDYAALATVLFDMAGVGAEPALT